MTFEIGNYGLQIVIGFGLAFGAAAQLAAGADAKRWLWGIGWLGWVAGALFASEVLFGKATVDEIQPIIDGLAYDEALLGGLVGGLIFFLAAWFVTRVPSGAATGHHAPI